MNNRRGENRGHEGQHQAQNSERQNDVAYDDQKHDPEHIAKKQRKPRHKEVKDRACDGNPWCDTVSENKNSADWNEHDFIIARFVKFIQCNAVC